MDFYVPRREDRRTWRGTADVAVYATVEEDDAHVQGYTLQGQRALLRAGQAVGKAVVLIAPAEPKGRRVDPQPVGPGEVIEEATDGTRSGSVGHRGPGGEWVDVDLADWIARGRSAAASGPSRAHFDFVPGSTTFLATFRPKFGDGLGDSCEVRYTLTYYRDGAYVDEYRVTDNNVLCPNVTKDYRTTSEPSGRALSPYEPRDGSSDEVRLHVRELDQWSDDDYGAVYWKAGEMLALKCRQHENVEREWCATLNW
jgi:hypothetical protein